LKLVIIEGVENSGKSTMMEDLRKQYGDKLSYFHFPSKELLERHYNAVTGQSDNIKPFIEDLIEEEYYALKGNDIVVIDRFQMSSMVFQGSKPYAPFGKNIFIDRSYQDLYDALGLKNEDIMTFVFMSPFTGTEDRDDLTEAQKENDKNADKYTAKYRDLLKNKNSFMCIKDILIFDESDTSEILVVHNNRKRWICNHIDKLLGE